MAVVSQSELILHRQEWKRNGKRVVCVAGAFDLLHPGHVRLLEQARGLGDILIVALQSDESVRIRRNKPQNLSALQRQLQLPRGPSRLQPNALKFCPRSRPWISS